MNRTWILVADAARARLFEVPKPGDHWRLLEEIDHPEGHARSREFLSNPSGGIEGAEGAVLRGALEPQSMKKVEARRFARQLGQRLDRGLAENRFDRVILVAAPEFLGMLRKSLSRGVELKLIDSISKDYGRSNARELEDQLGITHLA